MWCCGMPGVVIGIFCVFGNGRRRTADDVGAILVDFKINFGRVIFRDFVIGITSDAFYWCDWGRDRLVDFGTSIFRLIFWFLERIFKEGRTETWGKRADEAILR